MKNSTYVCGICADGPVIAVAQEKGGVRHPRPVVPHTHTSHLCLSLTVIDGSGMERGNVAHEQPFVTALREDSSNPN